MEIKRFGVKGAKWPQIETLPGYNCSHGVYSEGLKYDLFL